MPVEVSRGPSGSRAQRGSVARLLPRMVLCEVDDDGADGGGVFDAGRKGIREEVRFIYLNHPQTLQIAAARGA